MKKMISIITKGNINEGYLSLFESYKDIPFGIKRIYYIYDVPVNNKRGMHAHKNLQQILWCPYGEIEVILDDGKDKETYFLASPNNALIVKEGYWREIVWKKENSVLCVASSEYYDEEDYIRDYSEFIKYVKRGYWKNEN